MKRILISLCIAAALPAMAQSQPAKPASTKKAVVAPAKPKIVTMTRNELRACFKQQAANSAENLAIEKEKDAFQNERAGIVTDKDALSKQSTELVSLAKAIEAEGNKLIEAQKEFEQPVPKAEVKAVEARRIEFNDRVTAHQRKVDTYNADKEPFNKAKEALDRRIETNNARGKALQARAEQFNDTLDAWKASCSNKPYDVADEVAVKKELKAAGQ